VRPRLFQGPRGQSQRTVWWLFVLEKSDVKTAINTNTDENDPSSLGESRIKGYQHRPVGQVGRCVLHEQTSGVGRVAGGLQRLNPDRLLEFS
jgi:hypothetical protein